MTPPVHRAPSWPRRAARCSRPPSSRRAPTSTRTVADWEAEHLFLGGWVCVGHAQPLAARGAFFTREIGGESLLFMGDDEGRAHGFFNVCRHRGARLVDRARGHHAPAPVPLPRLVLRLRRQPQAARRTPRRSRTSTRLPRPQPRPHGGASTASLFADVSGTAGPLDDHLGDLAPHLEHYRLGELERAAAITYDVAGELEGDRRELLRVPALPRRAPRAQPPLALHERRRVRGRRAPGAAAR